MTPQQLHQTAEFLRKRYAPPHPAMLPGQYVSHEAMHALADALDRTSTTLHVDEPPAGGAPAAVHKAIDRAWSSVQEHTNGTLATSDDDDDDVLEQLRTLTDDDVRRAGFVLAITRGLSMVVRGDRTIARGEQ